MLCFHEATAGTVKYLIAGGSDIELADDLTDDLTDDLNVDVMKFTGPATKLPFEDPSEPVLITLCRTEFAGLTVSLP